MNDVAHQATPLDLARATGSELHAAEAQSNRPALEEQTADGAGALDDRTPKRQNGRAYLAVPFAEKDHAKAQGARWDGQVQSWYAPPGAEIASFMKWV